MKSQRWARKCSSSSCPKSNFSASWRPNQSFWASYSFRPAPASTLWASSHHAWDFKPYFRSYSPSTCYPFPSSAPAYTTARSLASKVQSPLAQSLGLEISNSTVGAFAALSITLTAHYQVASLLLRGLLGIVGLLSTLLQSFCQGAAALVWLAGSFVGAHVWPRRSYKFCLFPSHTRTTSAF
jgi:hypothetical protein